jgi:hypothetical protein
MDVFFEDIIERIIAEQEEDTGTAAEHVCRAPAPMPSEAEREDSRAVE